LAYWGTIRATFGKLGHEYKQIVFDKKSLTDDPTLEWVTPGHPLFEAVREDAFERVQIDLGMERFSLTFTVRNPPGWMSLSAAIRDGRGMFFTAVSLWWKQK